MSAFSRLAFIVAFFAVTGIGSSLLASGNRVPPFTIESQDVYDDIYQRVSYSGGSLTGFTLIDDAAATGGKAVRVSPDGNGFADYNHDCPALGWYRVTVRFRRESGTAAGLLVRFSASSDTTYFYHSAGTVDLASVTPASGYVERSTDVVAPGSAGYAAFECEVPGGLVVDWIKVQPAPAGSHPPVEILQAQPVKLYYPAGTAAQANIRLINVSPTTQSVRLRIRLEGGLADSATAYDGTLSVPASAVPQLFNLPIGVLPDGGSAVVGETLDGGGNVLSTARDYALSGASPVEVSPLYGLFVFNDTPTYSSSEALLTMDRIRKTYAALTEVDFWAPCETTLLTSPSDKDRWWSGQTLQRVGTSQVLGYKAAADAQGIGVVAYADYSDTYGWRVLESARKQPEILEWDVSNGNGPQFAFGMSPNNAAPLASRQRREDASEWSFTPADGLAQVMMSSHAMLKLHGDQLVAAMQQFGLMGYRYDDPLAYDADQIDLFGRYGPFGGWTNQTMIRYFRDRITAQNPGAIYGRNSDGMRTNNGGYSDVGGKTTQAATEAAILRGNGGFLLQESFSNEIFRRSYDWADVRRYFLNGGRNVKAGEGNMFAIVDTSAAPNDGELETIGAIAGASGVQLAYGPTTTAYLRFMARNSALLFGKKVQPVANPASTISVNAGGAAVWWNNYVYCRYVSPGRRQYIVHLINPPVSPTANAPASGEPAPLTSIQVALTPPAGWSAASATVLTPDQTARVRSFSEKIADKQYIPNDLADNLSKIPTSQPLALTGSAVTVPSLAKWSVVVFDCTGPTDDLPAGSASTLPPLPTVPDVTQPETARLVTTDDLAIRLQADTNNGGNASQLITDPTALGGTALSITNPTNASLSIYNVRPGLLVGTAGTYRFTARIRTTGSTVRNLVMTMRNSSAEPGQYSVSAPFNTTALTPADGWREFTCTLTLGETVYRDVEPGLQNLWAGLIIDDIKIERLTTASDATRLAINGQTPWPAKPGPFVPQANPRVFFGNGLYHEYFRLREALGSIAPGATIANGDPYLYGSENRGWNGIPFPDTPAGLLQKDLVILADIPANNNFYPNAANFAWLDWLRGYVKAGGRVIFTGGPYGFGRGGWNSDLIADMLPVTLTPRALTGLGYDLQKVTGGSVPLVPVGPLAQSLNWNTPPVTQWMHQVVAKPGATVQVTADGRPAVVTGSYGQGRVAVVLTAPLGDAPAGQTAFWDWPQWPALMGNVMTYLMSNEIVTIAPPQFGLAPGAYVTSRTVALSSATSGASIRYTLDGSDPTPESGLLYTAPITLTADTTLKAIAYQTGVTESLVVSGSYFIGGTAARADNLFSAALPTGGGTSNDSAYELGVKFRVALSGRITALRVFHPAGGPSSYTARLWTATGTELARVTFPAPNGAAWVEGALATPVSINSGVTYVASYSVPNGTNYYAVNNGLASSRISGSLSTVADGANGVYATTTGTFPQASFQSSNYFADVRFESGGDTFAGWTGKFLATLPSAQQTATADPDGDGVNNLLEYALGGDPLLNGPGILPVSSLIDSKLTLAFLRTHADLTYIVQSSSDLQSWSDLATNPGTVSNTTPVTAIDTLPLGSTKRFLRLKVTAP